MAQLEHETPSETSFDVFPFETFRSTTSVCSPFFISFVWCAIFCSVKSLQGMVWVPYYERRKRSPFFSSPLEICKFYHAIDLHSYFIRRLKAYQTTCRLFGVECLIWCPTAGDSSCRAAVFLVQRYRGRGNNPLKMLQSTVKSIG